MLIFKVLNCGCGRGFIAVFDTGNCGCNCDCDESENFYIVNKISVTDHFLKP